MIPAGTSDAATTIYYNGAGSAPRISIIGDSTIAALRWTNTFEPLKRFNFVYDAESCRRTAHPLVPRPRGLHAGQRAHARCAGCPGQLGSVLVIMGGYDDPGYGFAARRRRGDGRGGASGHPHGDVADDAHRRRVLRRSDVRLQHVHVPRQQPDPAAEGPAVRRSPADRRLGDVLGEPPGVVLRRRDPLPAGRTDGCGVVHRLAGRPRASPARRSRQRPARSRSCRGSPCAAATGARRSSPCSGR